MGREGMSPNWVSSNAFLIANGGGAVESKQLRLGDGGTCDARRESVVNSCAFRIIQDCELSSCQVSPHLGSLGSSLCCGLKANYCRDPLRALFLRLWTIYYIPAYALQRY